MAPLIPRLHLWEIDDQPWFPSPLRARVQDSLSILWTICLPGQASSPADHAARQLVRELGEDVSSYTYIDFCAGGGGPTPAIESAVNGILGRAGKPLVDFVLTDLHPNVPAWERVTRHSPRISYEVGSVDASRAPKHVTQRRDGKKVMRLFNLAFHHFDDPLASDILRNTVETSEGFAIFELQKRDLASLIGPTLFGLGAVLLAPYYSWRWRSPLTFFFSCIIPIIPFVLAFDGYISALRTRTPEEVEALLRGCGADTSEWEIRSGIETTLWPVGYMNWIICRPVKRT
ncbi:hypothetical protein S40285_02670 [Stachybotrys chlorohalonatus IBT 40285]|uniref:Methyltransferase domain-containing protein n=1 Tax=Stachybotrys chlorohalonatus (strain IBT 40285) TaxID=1283841 RepID=A0A084QMW6_STAC4|nr:hypothetical protein S40285_02670 [Stachybotrys chlorohalonata IBT 40285]